MKQKLLITFNLLFSILLFSQSGIITTSVYNKPLPQEITISGQPTNMKFTSHIVNIKIPQNEINNWNTNIEQQYIQSVFNYIPDKHFAISQYSGFYFPTSSGLTGLHYMKYKNDVQNIGLSLFNNNYIPLSQKFTGLIRMERDWFLRPNAVSHELFHQWNSYLSSANYWLIDPSFHTGLVEQSTSVFENYRNNFQPSQNNRFKYNQYFSQGFISPLEGYLAGLWDMPNNLRTLKNYYHGADVTSTFDNSCNCFVVDNVQAEGIVDLTKNQLFSMYGGERIPNYQNSQKNFDAVVIVFSALDFLSDNDLKIFHYASIVEETEGTATEYNQKYDEVFLLSTAINDTNYGQRQLNPHHASYKNLHFYTNIFNSPLSTKNSNFSLDYKLYPNPAKDFVSIKNNNNQNFTYQIVDISGKIIQTGKSKTGEKINVQSLEKGTYILQIQTENGEKQILKLMKN